MVRVLTSQTALSHGASLDAVNDAGFGALHVSAAAGHEEPVKMLIAAKATVDQLSSGNHTSLMAASENGHITCIEALLEAQVHSPHSGA